jgi:hypothetical protein
MPSWRVYERMRCSFTLVVCGMQIPNLVLTSSAAARRQCTHFICFVGLSAGFGHFYDHPLTNFNRNPNILIFLAGLCIRLITDLYFNITNGSATYKIFHVRRVPETKGEMEISNNLVAKIYNCVLFKFVILWQPRMLITAWINNISKRLLLLHLPRT